MFASVDRPYFQAFHSLHCLILTQLPLNFCHQLLVSAAIQQEYHTFADNGERGVYGHEGEEISAEGICQLPVGPGVSLRREEVNGACRNDDSDGEDDVSQDVDVSCLDIDIIVEGGSRRLN
jgi:hypothetical protein